MKMKKMKEEKKKENVAEVVVIVVVRALRKGYIPERKWLLGSRGKESGFYMLLNISVLSVLGRFCVC